MKPGTVFIIIAIILLSACNNQSSSSSKTDTTGSAVDSTMKEAAKAPSLKEENVTYTDNGVTMDGYVVYDANKEGKRPAILVVP